MSISVTFVGTHYTPAKLKEMSGSELVKLYNDIAKNLDESLVKRFSDKKSAVKRVWAILQRIPAPKSPKVEPKAESKVKLTDAEFWALSLCLNYDDMEAQLGDNFSNGGPTEFKQALGWTDHQVAGLISSLEKKGLGYCEEINDVTNNKAGIVFWLTEKGVQAVFADKEAGRKIKPVSAQAEAEKDAAPAEKRHGNRGTNIKPTEGAPVACRLGTKQAILVDMLSRENGATMEELLEALSGGRKPWTETTVRSGFGWDLKNKGYGVKSVFAEDGTERFHLVVPEGFDIPPHRVPKTAPKNDANQ